MAMQRFMKKCEEFTICGSTGDENTLFTDGYPENIAIYHITTIGNVKMAKPTRAMRKRKIGCNKNKW